MALNLLGKKKGMTQVFDNDGKVSACTMILLEPNVVVQKKKKEKDGYESIQLGMGIKRNPTKPLQKHFEKANVKPCRYLKESRFDNVDEYEVGQEINASFFAEGDYVDVIGVSKGKGYQGVMKLHGFAGGPAAHGSGFHRHAGSTGMRSTPGRCFAGGKRASRMGGKQVTVETLEVLHVDAEKNILVLKGAVPGANQGTVVLRKSRKKQSKKK